jgi:hypothetical protein
MWARARFIRASFTLLTPLHSELQEKFIKNLMDGAANLASAGATMMSGQYVTQYTAPKKVRFLKCSHVPHAVSLTPPNLRLQDSSKFYRDPWTDARIVDPNPILGWTHEDVMLKNYYQGGRTFCSFACSVTAPLTASLLDPPLTSNPFCSSGNELNREYSQVPLSWGLSSGFGDAYTSQMIKYQCPTQNQLLILLN